jgi:bifunctional UDP-N-acetylglucosamine pyrophosphorylase / glucosamine-1-phosphate N-acetyltransferase
MNATAILLAAGFGTRMRSEMPKALHPLAGRPMLRHLIASCEAAFDRLVVVAGPGMPALEKAAAPHGVAIQHERLGTAHAALQAAPLLDGFAGDVAVLYADNPLIARGRCSGCARRVPARTSCCWRCAPSIPRATAAW